jgi:hypothetical protein
VQILLIAIIVLVSGAVGGFLNAFLTGSLHLPRHTADTYRPGWMANVVIGAIAAFVLWTLFDPAGSAAVVGDGSMQAKGILSVGNVVASIAVGISAAHLLASDVQKKRLAA